MGFSGLEHRPNTSFATSLGSPGGDLIPMYLDGLLSVSNAG